MLKVIEERHSSRSFSDQKVNENTINDLLKAAMQAPTARNIQNWRFMVIENRKALDEMPSLQPYTNMMKEAPCAIMVMGDTTAYEEIEYTYLNCAAAIQNILLEAVHQDLKSCWCAIAPQAKRISNFAKYYHLADNILPIGVIAIGYANENHRFRDRFDPKKIQYLK